MLFKKLSEREYKITDSANIQRKNDLSAKDII